MNFFEIEETEKNLDIKIKEQFIEYLWQLPKHWFQEGHKTFPEPISYALYQGFCLKYGYEFGKFDLEEHRKLPPVQLIKHKKNNLTYLWGEHPNDFKILKPIFLEEKEKYKKSKPT